jgi:transcriptional regulator with XRE-family HTH domain
MAKQKASTAERLREAMVAAGKRQVDLVRETGIDRGSISSYLSGRYVPKQTAINKLAIALGVSEMWLWGYDAPAERTIEQKNNDIITNAVVKMRNDEKFFSVVESLLSLNEKEFSTVAQMLTALQK